MTEVSPIFRRFFNLLARVQVERPWLMGLIAVLTLVPAILATQRLGLKTDFSELLPENKPSVVEMRRVGAKLTSASTLTMVAEVPASHPEALEKFAEAVVPRIQALGPSWVGAVDSGRREAARFFEQNKLLFAPLDEIQKVHDEVRERYDYEVQKRAGGDLGLDEPPPPLTAATIRERFGKAAEKLAAQTSDYYIGEDGKMLAILIRTPVEPGSIEASRRLRARIDEIVASVSPAQFDAEMAIRYTGDFITSVEEYESVKNDLGHVGFYGLLLVLGAVMLFFLSVRPVIAMTLTIGIAFLDLASPPRSCQVSQFVTGFPEHHRRRQYNFGIIYMARYLEVASQENAGEAVAIAHHDTWLATLAAAGAAMLSYGSLVATDADSSTSASSAARA
jgi:predicted RND superfamily exporter protein